MKGRIWKIASLLLVAIFILSAAASAHAATLTTVIPSPTIDQTAVVCANGYVFVSGYTGGDVEVISDATNAQIANIQVYFGAPYGLAYDSNKGEIWVATTGGACAFSDFPPFNSVVNVTDTNGFEQAAFDAKTGEVFMAYNGVISVISDKTNTIVANITQDVTAMVDDSAKGEIFVAQGSNGEGGVADVLVISAQTNSVTATIPVNGDYLTTIAYDSGKGEIFVGTQLYSYNLTAGESGYVIQVLSDSAPYKLLKTISMNLSTSVQLGPMAYNPNKGEIYINDGTLVAIISDQTYSIATVSDNGTSGGGIAYDSGTSSVYAINSQGDPSGTLGSVAVISDPSSSSSGSSPTPTGSSSTGTSSTATPTSTPKVPEFSSPALASVAAALLAAALCTFASARKKQHLDANK